MSDGFQTRVAAQPAPAVAGDFASMNPYFTVDAGPGGLVSGPNGCVVGRFAWAANPSDGDGFPSQVNSYGTGSITGFVPREQQGLITHYLEDSSEYIPKGFQMTLMNGGDFWVKNDGLTQALPGMKAYANFADGKVTFAATGSATAGGTSTASTIDPKLATVTASIVNDTLIVTAQSGDIIVPGAIRASGAGVATGTAIVRQLTSTETDGALGKKGTYAVSIPDQAVASEAMTFGYGLLTVIGTLTGSFGVNDTIVNSGGTAITGTYITALGTGAGGLGTYYVNKTQTVTAQAINVAAINVETKWVCMSSGLPGELVKMSDHALG